MVRKVRGTHSSGCSGSADRYGIFNFRWPPKHQREVIAAGGESVTDQLHLVWAGVAVLFIFVFIAFGAAAFAKQFRLYCIGTVLVLLFFGALKFPSADAIATGQPSPWAGVWERIQVGEAGHHAKQR